MSPRKRPRSSEVEQSADNRKEAGPVGLGAAQDALRAVPAAGSTFISGTANWADYGFTDQGSQPPLSIAGIKEAILKSFEQAEELRKEWLSGRRKRLQALDKVYATFDMERLSLKAKGILWLVEHDAVLYKGQIDYLTEHIERAQAIRKVGWDCNTDQVALIEPPGVPHEQLPILVRTDLLDSLAVPRDNESLL